MATGLSVDRVVKVAVNLQPLAAGRRNFGVLCIAGDSAVIDGLERLRSYTSIEGVADDFGTTDPEYLAALLYFSQSPKPSILYIARWVREDSPGLLYGGMATTTMETWTAITDGSMSLAIDGDAVALTSLDFHSATNMNGVASVINTALGSDGDCTWDGTKFIITSGTAGADSSVGYATSGASGTNVSALAGLTATLAYDPVPGYDAETPVQCAETLADVSGEWYGLMFAASTMPTDDQSMAVAGFIEAASKARVFGYTVTDIRAKSAVYASDLFTRLKALSYDRSIGQYSTSSPYAVASLLGRAFTVNFNANRSAITLKFKTEPGIVAETITETEATALAAKNANVFVNYDNDTAIVQEGKVASGAYFDEVHGLDWLQNAIQTECFNLLYQSKTKVPQTESGVGQIVSTIAKVCREAINNGLIAPGVWNADGFGQLAQGDYLPQGFYIYSQPIVDQAQSEREARKAPPIQVAAKLAGAVHFVDVAIDVNR